MNRPYIICHMETSLDGKIMGKYLWLPTDEGVEDSFYLVQNKKYEYQALIFGRTTIDDNHTMYLEPQVDPEAAAVPEGDYLAEGRRSGQFFIAVDSKGKLAWQENMAEEGGVKRHIVEILTETTPNSYKDFLRRKGISYLICGKDSVDLKVACQKIKEKLHVDTMMLGGGGTLNWSFLQAGLVDEVSQVIAPAADGSIETQTLFMAQKGLSQDQPIRFKPLHVEIMPDGAVWIRWEVGEKTDFDFYSDPEFKKVMTMIQSHK